MRKLLLVLIAAAVQVSAAITVSNVTADHISHGTALLNFHVVNPSPAGDGTLWGWARICWSTTAGACAGHTGAQTYMATSFPANGASSGVRNGADFRLIITGLPASSTIEACPELSMTAPPTGYAWSADVCTSFTTLGKPASTLHGVPELPRGTVPTVPSDYTGFHSGFSAGDTVISGETYPVTSCANAQSDYNHARDHQLEYGTVIALAAGSTCAGRIYPENNPPDVVGWNPTDVNLSTNKIHIPSHGLTEGHGVQFSHSYRSLPGETSTTAFTCTGMKPGQVYYAHNVTTDDFGLTCDAPFSQGGTVMVFKDAGSGSGFGGNYMAPYPRRKDQGGSLYPIILRTSTPDSQLPPPGTRVGPQWSSKLAAIQPDNLCGSNACFYAKIGLSIQSFALNFGDSVDDNQLYLNANQWAIGLEIQSIVSTDSGNYSPAPTWELVQFKEGTSDNGVDRCYIHGQYPFPNRLAHGFAWEGHNNMVSNSYFDKIVFPWHNNSDGGEWNMTEGTQFIEASRGPGPYYFINNFFQSTGNGMHFNGAGDNGFDTKVIRDVYIKRNTYTQNPPDNHQQYCSGNTGADGWVYRNRQPLEFKGGFRIFLDGNIFEYDCHDRASSAVALTSVTAGISDITFTNNTWRHVSGATMMGSCTQGGPPTCMAPTSRYLYRNNLIWDTDGAKYIDHQSAAYNAGHGFAWNGWVVQTVQDGEDMTWDHNTVVSASGWAPAQWWMASGGVEGFKFTNSIFEAHADTNQTGNGARIEGATNPDEATGNSPTDCVVGGTASVSAEALLTCPWRYPGAVVGGNLATSDSLTNSQVLAVWPSQETTATPSNLDLVGWTQRDYTKPAQDFHLRNDSPFISGGSGNAPDGRDMGADIDALDKAQGKVYFTSVIPASTTATVNFVAPDAQGCPVDVSSSDSTLITTFTRTADAGTSSGPRSVSVSGLTAHTNYYFRVNCAVEQPTGQFHTN